MEIPEIADKCWGVCCSEQPAGISLLTPLSVHSQPLSVTVPPQLLVYCNTVDALMFSNGSKWRSQRLARSASSTGMMNVNIGNFDGSWVAFNVSDIHLGSKLSNPLWEDRTSSKNLILVKLYSRTQLWVSILQNGEFLGNIQVTLCLSRVPVFLLWELRSVAWINVLLVKVTVIKLSFRILVVERSLITFS